MLKLFSQVFVNSNWLKNPIQITTPRVLYSVGPQKKPKSDNYKPKRYEQTWNSKTSKSSFEDQNNGEGKKVKAKMRTDYRQQPQALQFERKPYKNKSNNNSDNDNYSRTSTSRTNRQNVENDGAEDRPDQTNAYRRPFESKKPGQHSGDQNRHSYGGSKVNAYKLNEKKADFRKPIVNKRSDKNALRSEYDAGNQHHYNNDNMNHQVPGYMPNLEPPIGFPNDYEDMDDTGFDDTGDIESFIKSKGIAQKPNNKSVRYSSESENIKTYDDIDDNYSDADDDNDDDDDDAPLEIRLSDPVVNKQEIEVEPVDVKEESIEDIIKNMRPAFRPYAYNLAYFVNESDTLKKFIEMGVNIKKWDSKRDVCEFVLRLDFNKHIAPYLIFLHDIGIKATEYGPIIESNPLVFKQKLDDLQVRIEYLRSKRFTSSEICVMVNKVPKMLNMSVDTVDNVLGWYQREFNLNGSELRKIIVDRPALIGQHLKVPGDLKFFLKEMVRYNDEQIKQMIKTNPKLFTSQVKSIKDNLNYMANVMKFSNTDIASYSMLLHMSLLTLKHRFSYLKHLGLDQFDPSKPRFVSGRDLSSAINDDQMFCKKVTKTTLEDYENFLKTL